MKYRSKWLLQYLKEGIEKHQSLYLDNWKLQ